LRIELMLSLGVFVVLSVLIVLFGLQLQSQARDQRAQAVSFYQNSDKIDVQAIVDRLNLHTRNDVDSAAVTSIASGNSDIRDHLLRAFTAPYYLSTSADDEHFISDAYTVVTGQTIESDKLEQAKLLLQQTGSRLAWIDELCESLELPGSAIYQEDPTRIRTFTLISDLPEQGQRIIGLLPVSAEMKISGDEARIKLFSNGHLQQSHAYGRLRDQMVEEDIENESIITVYWDTRYERSGNHKLDYLIQTSDGRGHWISLDSFVIPEDKALEYGQIEAVDLQAMPDHDAAYDNSQEAWYRIDSADNAAMLTLFQSDTDLDLELINIMGSPRASSSSREGVHAALRYQGTDEDILPLSLRANNEDSSVATSYYVRISRREQGTLKNAHYSILHAETAAITTQAPYRYVAVLEASDDQLTIAEIGREASWQPAENYELLSSDSRLGLLKLQDVNGAEIDFAPVFNNDHYIYGLYVLPETGMLNFETWAVEGSAAELEVSINYEDGSMIALDSADLIEIKPSVNNLRLQVTGFKGNSEVYELKILKSPALDGYHQVLEAFPLSYRTPLWAIHLERPSWEFRPDDTQILWSDFVEAQDLLDKNLVEAGYSPEHWVEPGSPVYDGASWKAAATEVIAYFGDPRHALNSVDLFQFESLRFEQDVHTREGVAAMLENTFMSAGNDDGIKYADMIYQAGNEADISPFFIAAKIIQEMGPQGQSLLAHGELPGYEGIFNFYNIGSTPNPEVENGALINGARFAQFGKDPTTEELDEEEQRWLIPWNTRQKAITGGAIWIADRYVSIGQDTLYGQKFDLVADPDLFMRQYAQNIQMAWAEGRRTFRAYRDLELLDEPFAFKIPVFLEMPAEVSDWP
ncbi:MAG: hypothetical protein GX028_01290, partial [Clostridiaceae bacterium]|nr:hypothetical protein [Clostridiaceae bacterium]